MGQPMPGFAAGIVDDAGAPVTEPNVTGQIAIDVPASTGYWFAGYLDAPEKTASRYTEDGRWYLTAHDLDRDAPRVFRLDRISGSSRTGRKKKAAAPITHSTMAATAARTPRTPSASS